ncbi:GlsB/YeaQ/YmgE family stress response membrane protein [Gordonia sp. DT218]|uniref:GlsB/YeaQ/YmgE family stress response membrane protein n=1 Tax=unclassified Gordonia (in: high G+C Gram-positive bacteria) TaxID=2657482 RepID=UPI003CEF53E8
MLILGIIVFGMVIGALAQLIIGGKNMWSIDWGLAIVAGLVGSFVGGLLISLLSGDGINFRASGIIGSIVGALLVTGGWIWYKKRSPAN